MVQFETKLYKADQNCFSIDFFGVGMNKSNWMPCKKRFRVF